MRPPPYSVASQCVHIPSCENRGVQVEPPSEKGLFFGNGVRMMRRREGEKAARVVAEGVAVVCGGLITIIDSVGEKFSPTICCSVIMRVMAPGCDRDLSHFFLGLSHPRHSDLLCVMRSETTIHKGVFFAP